MHKNISKEQAQTEDTFGFKWKKTDTYESAHVQKEWQRWLLEKYFSGELSSLDNLLMGGRKKILDAGCGGGVSASLLFGNRLNEHNYLGVDISDSIEVAAQRFQSLGLSGKFLQSDLNTIPIEYGSFDIIFSEGVLHHTDSVEDSLISLSKRLKDGGHFLFYVYAKKAPLREYSDDYIREYISSMTNEEAWEALMPLTEFGKLLGDLDIEIDIKTPIPLLGIEKGVYNLQRLIYYKFFKAYYQKEYSLDEMNHINFDWFRPKNCYRHTPEQIEIYCKKSNLEIKKMNVEESGITVIAQKRSV